MSKEVKKKREFAPLDLSVGIHRGILLAQRKVRWIRLAVPFELSALESILLSHLAYDPNRQAGELVTLLGVSRSKVSRLLSDLEESGAINCLPAAEDKRRREISFTDAGKRLIQEADRLNSRIAQLACAFLSPKEHLQLVALFSKMNDGFGAPKETVRAGEDPFAPQQRRMVIGSGMLSRRYLNSHYSLAEHQLFFELQRRERPLHFGELCEALPVSPSKLSRLLTEMEKKGLVQKRTLPEDKRTKEFSYTSEGLRFYRELEEAAGREYADALEACAADELQELIRLLELIHQAPVPSLESTGFRIRACRDGNERKQARAFLVESLVRAGLHRSLDSTLLPSEHNCILAVSNDEILGLTEIVEQSDTPNEASAATLRYFQLSPSLSKKEQAVKTFRDSVRLFFDSSSKKALTIPHECLPKDISASLPAVEKNGQTFSISREQALAWE